MQSREGWFREGAHGREVSVGDIRVEPVRDEAQEAGRDMKYRMTAVINGEEISHEITRRQYDPAASMTSSWPWTTTTA